MTTLIAQEAVALAIDSSNLYANLQLGGQGNIVSVAKTGGPVTTLAFVSSSNTTLGPALSASDGVLTYWTTYRAPMGPLSMSSVSYCLLPGGPCADTNLSNSGPGSVSVATRLGIIYATSVFQSAIDYEPYAGDAGSVKTLVTMQGAEYLTADKNNLYWSGSGGVTYTPLAGMPDSGAPTTLAPGYYASALSVDPANVYFVVVGFPDGGGNSYTLYQVPIAGGSVNQLSTTSTDTYSALATDGASIYVSSSTTISKCVAPSCVGGPVPLIQGRSGIGPIAVDDQFLYWGETGAIAKVPK